MLLKTLHRHRPSHCSSTYPASAEERVLWGRGTTVAPASLQHQQQELGLLGLCARCGRCPPPQGLVCGGPGASVSPDRVHGVTRPRAVRLVLASRKDLGRGQLHHGSVNRN